MEKNGKEYPFFQTTLAGRDRASSLPFAAFAGRIYDGDNSELSTNLSDWRGVKYFMVTVNFIGLYLCPVSSVLIRGDFLREADTIGGI